MDTLRIVLLGKTGSGKSNCANTILDEELFLTETSPNSISHRCESKTKFISGKNITVVDTPGFFDTDLPEEKLKSEIVRCITECAPGPHACVIVLKVERYTEHEKETVKKITDSFGEEALKHTVVLFTHGDQLPEDQTIEDFLGQSAELQKLVDKCGGRAHVIDNKYWKQEQEKNSYRSNRVQVEKILNTIEEMVKKNGGQYYTNEILKRFQEEKEAEYERIRRDHGHKFTDRDMREQAKENVQTKWTVRLAGMATGAVLGALLGAAGAVGAVLMILKNLKPLLGAAVLTPKERVCVLAGSAVVGGVGGGVSGGAIGYKAAEGAETVTEAVKKAAEETCMATKNAVQGMLTAKMKQNY